MTGSKFASTGLTAFFSRQGSCGSGVRCLAAAVLALCAGTAPVAGTDDASLPRSPSAAERAAVAFALDYLAHGPSAWVPLLSADSRFANMSASEAESELEARLGPSSGARWELRTIGGDSKDGAAFFTIDFPSGLDTGVLLRVANQGPAWKIEDVRILEEPEARVETSGNTRSASNDSGRDDPPPAARLDLRTKLSAVSLVISASLFGLAIVFYRRRRAFMLLLGGCATAAVLAGAGSLLPKPPATPPTQPAKHIAARPGDADERLGSLRLLRKALSTSDSVSSEELLKRTASGKAAGQIARLWAAEWAIRERDLVSAERLLREFPEGVRIPQVEILRARLAFLQNRPRDVALAYAEALRRSPDHDGLLFEAALLLRLLSDETTADAYILEAAHKGSRMAEVQYAQAAYWVKQEKGVEAEKWFRQGWELHPMERATLLGQSFFWDLLRRPELYASLQLDSPAEPTVTAAQTSASPVDVPPGTEARLCGAYLRFRLSSAELHVPGGAALAPRGTPVDDAGAWTRDEEKTALADLPKLAVLARSGAALLQPLLRRQVEAALSALARRHRWEQIANLTEGIQDAIERAPSEFILYRAEALRRTDRTAASRELVTRAAQTPAFVRRSNPGDLFSLATLLGGFGDYDRGIELAEKARAKLRVPVGDAIVQRMKMERKLAGSYSTHTTEHFLIRSPREHPESGTRKLALVLEGERERLSKWIPLRSFGKTEVQLLWFDEFQKTFSGSVALAGLFDGKIRLPFAGGESLDFSHPEIVAIATHELAHAMISELTLDSTPHWFQEGLAQHVEMRPEHFNPVPLQETQHRLLSLTAVEGVLEGLPAPDLAESSYEESVWMVHYIEATSGVKGIIRILQAFRGGADTEEALQKLGFASLPEFEARFRTWSRSATARSWKGPMKRYLGNRASDLTVPASLNQSAHRIRWNQSEEAFAPSTTPRR